MTLEESGLAKEELRRFEAEVASLVKQAWSAVLQMNREQMRICQEQAEWLLAQRDILISRERTNLATLPMLESLAAQVQAGIPKNALVLEYALVDESVWVLALSRDTLKAHRIGLNRFSATVLAESFRYECDGVLPTHALKRLGNELLMPIEDQLHDFSMVIVILPRELFGLPFHAMWVGSAPLIETHEVLYVPSASFLTQPAKDRSLHDITAESSCVVLSVPSVPYVAVEALRGAYEEVRMVSSLFRSPSLLKDAQASSDRLLNLPEGTQILHLACHAQFEREYPLLGRLLLADRPVFAFEIMMANLNLDLANLSACQTAAAKAYLGGETEGLMSAFAAAGARTVLASSWPMDDSAGYEFTSTFYQQLLGEQIRSPWSAARAGQRMLKDRPDTCHPYFWAPFVVIGTPSLENYE
jgi:CHAT domain-containing protein